MNIEPTPDMEPYMENWLEWWDQSTSSCQKTGRPAELRERMRKEKENIALWTDNRRLEESLKTKNKKDDRMTAERKKAAFVKSFFRQHYLPNEKSAGLAEQSADTAPTLAEQDVFTPSRLQTSIQVLPLLNLKVDLEYF